MRRLLLLLSALSLCLLAWGTAYHPDFAAFWLASGEPLYQIVRLLLTAALFIQLVTHPPRNIYFRLLCGIVAAGAAYWAIEQTYSYHMQFFDTLAFLGASTATGITALELEHKPEEHRTGKHVFVG